MDTSPTGRPESYVVAEYQAATDAYLHYDSFRWQSGSLLIAGAFVFLGLLASGSESSVLDFGALAITFVMSAWLVYAQHHRNLYLFKLDRIAELERVMGAEQNLRFRASSITAVKYSPVGVPGHVMDRITAVGISVAGLALAFLKGVAGMYSLISLLLICGIVIWVVAQDRRVRAAIASKAPVG